MAKKTEALEKKSIDTALEAAPEWMEQTAVGADNIAREDVQMPRLALAQQMSPQCTPGKPEYNEDMRVGDLFNSLNGEIYGKGPIRVIPIRIDEARWVEFVPREEGGGVRDMNVPPGDPRTLFGVDGEGKPVPPVATKFLDYILLMADTMEPIALSFKGSGLKAGRDLNGLIKMRQMKSPRPIYGMVFEISTDMKTNAKGTFAIYKVANAGWVQDQAQYDACKKAFEAMAGKDVNIHREEGDTDFPNPEDDGKM